MNIGNKIYELRSAKNLSQGDLAELLEVSRPVFLCDFKLRNVLCFGTFGNLHGLLPESGKSVNLHLPRKQTHLTCNIIKKFLQNAFFGGIIFPR